MEILTFLSLIAEKIKKVKRKVYIIQQRKKGNTILKMKKITDSIAALIDMIETKTEGTMMVGEKKTEIEIWIEEIEVRKEEIVKGGKGIVRGETEIVKGVTEIVQGGAIMSLGLKMNLELPGR